MSDLATVLDLGLSACRVAVDQGGDLLAGLFLTGLVGSLTHCSGMCGPFVLSQGAARLEAVPLAAMNGWTRVKGALLLPYHLGRGTAYAVLGVGAALFARSLAGDALKWFSALLLGVSALMLLGMAVPALRRMADQPAPWATALLTRLSPLFQAPTGWRGYVLGFGLGFIPCGLVYAALAAAAASGQGWTGGLAMLAFWAGTVPMLIAVGIVGHFALSRWRGPVLKWAPVLLLFNAAVLGALALQLLMGK